MADMTCEHRCTMANGVCEECGVKTCQFGIAGCRCAVGWPHDLQCPKCRDRERRLDDGYCVCTPSSIPPRVNSPAQPPITL